VTALLRGRLSPAAVLGLLVIGISGAVRLALALRPEVRLAAGQWPGTFGIGLYYDFAVATLIAAPAGLVLALAPERLARNGIFRGVCALAIAIAAYGLLVIGVAEWVFWDEFAARFNFIAVDYLIYTREVLGNIWQSYPVGWWLALLVLPAAAITAAAAPILWRRMMEPAPMRARLRVATLLLGMAVVSASLVASGQRGVLAGDVAQELAGNGIWEFFAALRSNELDYERYYATLSSEHLHALTGPLLSRSGERQSAARRSLAERVVLDSQPEKRLSVVLISIESLGAEFMSAFGNDKGITPRLDELAKESLFFTNVFATGNRTVRGLEALSLALPPTPGQSIVKRPANGRLFTLGSVFEDRGYATRFMYGGYGYFDGMNAFFSANDYQAVDRTAIRRESIQHENIWGVADEHLFDFALEEIERARGTDGARPFFAHIMTTSNHRPYTYPEGRIDIPSGNGRDGAVKYSDFAIGRFIDAARSRPWFDDTVFVIVADHGASARGTTSIPVEQYRIPLLIFSPKHVAAARVGRLMSQIDVAPTLLGRLRFSYHTKFMGRDIFRADPSDDRAFVANYQTLGYLRDGRLITLEPRRKSSVRSFPASSAAAGLSDEQVRAEAIAWYQTAARYYRTGQLDDDESNQIAATEADARRFPE